MYFLVLWIQALFSHMLSYHITASLWYKSSICINEYSTKDTFLHNWWPDEPFELTDIAFQQWTKLLKQLHKSHNAPVSYLTMHHFVTEMCTFLLQNGALWDMRLVHCGICGVGTCIFNRQHWCHKGLKKIVLFCVNRRSLTKENVCLWIKTCVLIHWGLVTHICVSKLGRHWCR